jgi:phosphoribosylamine--glycine ligase
VSLLAEAAAGRLRSAAAWSPQAAVTVVLASEGYPEAPRTGDVIAGLDDVRRLPGVVLGCAGVDRDAEDRLVTSGGRVLSLTGIGAGLADARRRAYAAVAHISWPGMQYRRDIAGAVVSEAEATSPVQATSPVALAPQSEGVG